MGPFEGVPIIIDPTKAKKDQIFWGSSGPGFGRMTIFLHDSDDLAVFRDQLREMGVRDAEPPVTS